jgi:predicted secreted protein
MPMTREGPSTKVTASNGQALVRLPETPSTGYEWQLAARPKSVRVVSEEYVDEQREPVAGGSGEHVFHLELSSPGPELLDFELRRPWEDQPLERRRVQVREE